MTESGNKFLKLCNHLNLSFNFDEGFSFVRISSKTIKEAASLAGLLCPSNGNQNHNDSPDTLCWFVHLDFDEFPILFGDDWKDRIVCRFSKDGDLSKDNDIEKWKLKNCDLTEANCRGAKNEKGFYILHVLNHQPVTEDFSVEKAQWLSALCRLEPADAKYILSRVSQDGKKPLYVVFSRENADNGLHSVHDDSDYHALNLLFNMPANSDTLVSWYILAKAYDLCENEDKKENIRKDILAWRINDSWMNSDKEKIERLVMDDFEYLVDSFGLVDLKQDDSIKNVLKEFAWLVYNPNGGIFAPDKSDSMGTQNSDPIEDLLQELKKIFSPEKNKEGKK